MKTERKSKILSLVVSVFCAAILEKSSAEIIPAAVKG